MKNNKEYDQKLEQAIDEMLDGKKDKIIICPICTKADGLDLLEQIKVNPEMANNLVRGEICETCKEVMADGITLLCENCDALTVANTDKFQEVVPWVQKGEKFLIYRCPGCKPEDNPEGKFIFINPSE